jgi:lipopolysaccharide biosynthesis glycosyltransferase
MTPDSGMDTIRIVSASDDAFALPLGVMLTSLFENSPFRDRIVVTILDGGISFVNREKILRIAEKYRAVIQILAINKDKFKGLVTPFHLKTPAYYRLAIPDLLDAAIDKVLYLDCDLIVQDDISHLWNVDISHHYLAAVESVGIERGYHLHDTKTRLKIPVGNRIFNSGVMIINLAQWRKDNIHHKIVEFILHNPDKIRLADQDGLNALLSDKWLSLPLRWNQQTILHKIIQTSKDPEFIEAINNPAIIHFTGGIKPWHYSDDHPQKKEYLRYRAMTEWEPVGEPIEVSVILPALDEEQTIGTCLAKIRKVFEENNIPGEIIVADASTDRTAEIARSMGATVIHPEKNGYGNAYLAAFRQARGQCYVIGDSDDTYDFLEIPLLIAPLKNGADLVIGSRFRGTIHPGSMTPLHRYIGNPFLTWMVNWIFHTRFSDTHSGFRAITREALDRLSLKSGGMEFASEMLIMASKENLRIEEVPINYYPRKTPSKLHSFADGWRHVRFVLLMKPLPFIAIPGLVFAVVGVLLMGFFYLNGNVESSHLHTFILGAIMVMGGTQVVVSALLMKTYSVIHGYETKAGIIELFMRYHNLEKFLMAGALLAFAGILIGLNIFIWWISENFGLISQISEAIISLVLITTGIQIFLFAVFQSMMLLNENNGSG